MTFKGGVHPYDGKEFSKAKPVRKLLPKGELVFPLSQHIGAPASPIVNVGDYVLRGQKIAEAGGFVSSPIFSSENPPMSFFFFTKESQFSLSIIYYFTIYRNFLAK